MAGRNVRHIAEGGIVNYRYFSVLKINMLFKIYQKTSSYLLIIVFFYK